jgi:hypothetical protein
VNGTFPTVTFVNNTQLKVPVTAAQIATPGAFQVWVGNSPTAATCDAFAALPFTVANNPIMVSRMTHGGAAFDVNLPLTGKRGVECRSGGANGNYTVVFQFGNSLTSVGGASVAQGTGSVSGRAIGANNHEYVVSLTGITNAQYITVSLTNVQDAAGNSGNLTSPQMGVLVGDTNADGFTDAIDVSQTKSQSGHAVTNANFREDVNVDTFIDAIDVSLVKSKSGTALPSSP